MNIEGNVTNPFMTVPVEPVSISLNLEGLENIGKEFLNITIEMPQEQEDDYESSGNDQKTDLHNKTVTNFGENDMQDQKSITIFDNEKSVSQRTRKTHEDKRDVSQASYATPEYLNYESYKSNITSDNTNFYSNHIYKSDRNNISQSETSLRNIDKLELPKDLN